MRRNRAEAARARDPGRDDHPTPADRIRRAAAGRRRRASWRRAGALLGGGLVVLVLLSFGVLGAVLLPEGDPDAWALLGAGVLGVVLPAIVVAHRRRPRSEAAPYAVVAAGTALSGVLFEITAAAGSTLQDSLYAPGPAGPALIVGAVLAAVGAFRARRR